MHCTLVNDPIVVNAPVVLVGFSDDSGIGRRYALNLATGDLMWATESGPWSYVTPVRSAGTFLVGRQGYGAFELDLIGPAGQVLDKWSTDGFPVVLPDGIIRVVEMENMLPSRMHVCELAPQGEVRKGPWLDEYYTTRPAVSDQGDLVFCRNGEIICIDANLRRHVLAREASWAHTDFAVLSAMHLRGDGTLAFTIDAELVTLATALRPYVPLRP
jgi:hypothetical protein